MGYIKLFFVSASITLVGCATPSPMLATKAGISFQNVLQTRLPEVSQQAQAHCQKYGKDARYIPDNRPDGIATFTCE